MERRSVVLLLALAGLLGLPGSGAAVQGEALWTLLQAGGHVILIRHTVTTPGVGDPPGMQLTDCATQRNLSEEGRRDARRIGDVFRSRGIPVARVLSSPWCRCLDTARLAFGEAEAWPPLSNLFGRPENRAPQIQELERLVGQRLPAGNLVLVSHGSTIDALTGVSPAPGELVVLTPQGGRRFTVAGRLTAG
jgi:phosphohistidine phosphatase SixA